MSWIVKFEKEVESCDECPLCDFRKNEFSRTRECFIDGTPITFHKSEDEPRFYVVFPSEVRPCPLKVHATPIDVNEANKQSEKDYSSETGV